MHYYDTLKCLPFTFFSYHNIQHIFFLDRHNDNAIINPYTTIEKIGIRTPVTLTWVSNPFTFFFLITIFNTSFFPLSITLYIQFGILKSLSVAFVKIRVLKISNEKQNMYT
jgi:hypothetical protein